MNELISLHSQTMSSRELLTIINVCRAEFDEPPVRLNDFNNRVVDELDGYHYESFVVNNPNGTQSTEHRLTIDQCILVGMRESKAVRRKVLEKLTDMKSQQKLAPKTYVEALRALADEVEAHNKTQEQLAIAAPKSEYFDKLVERNLLTNFTVTAKEFGIKRKDLIDYLLVNKYVYRDAYDNIVAYAAHVPTLFEIKEFAKEKHAGTQTLITPHGRETFRRLMGI